MSLRTRSSMAAACAFAATTAAGTLGAPTAGAATAAPGVSAQVGREMRAQLHRLSGGIIIAPNKIHYKQGDVTLIYPTSTMGSRASVAPATINGCSDGSFCMWTAPGFAAGSLALQTGSIWCDENGSGMGHALQLNQYGLYGKIRSIDSENALKATGYWEAFGWSSVQWTLQPYSDNSSVSPDHIAWVDICPT